jgi:predicted TIM-barrel fold metal-dependent hydrolase
MIIDFHTHIFPNMLAAKTVKYLAQKAAIPSYGKATLEDMKERIACGHLSAAVAAHIVTNAAQQKNVNDFAVAINKEPVYSFASVYPDAKTAVPELERLKKAGIRGIKLHPEYQNFYPDSPHMYPIYEKCAELKLLLLFHAGYDPGYGDSHRAGPARIAKAARDFPSLLFIAAHLGGYLDWDAAEEYLCGLPNVFFDTSHINGAISPAQALKIIRLHGADKILFGTDLPWATQQMMADFLLKTGINETERELIFYKNAAGLLKINA